MGENGACRLRAGWLSLILISPAVAAQQGITGDCDGKKVRLRPLARDEAGRLTAALAAHRIDVFEITTVRKDLEHIFLELIGDQ